MLIDACGEAITSKIISGIQQAEIFTAIADETADCALLEQLCIVTRYLKGANMREDLVGMCDISRKQTGIDIAGNNQFSPE